MFRKRNSNLLTKLLLDYIEQERYIGDKLSIRIIKKNKKAIDYSILINTDGFNKEENKKKRIKKHKNM